MITRTTINIDDCNFRADICEGRVATCTRFIDNYLHDRRYKCFRTGTRSEFTMVEWVVPVVYIGKDGRYEFENGNHRTTAWQRKGHTTIEVDFFTPDYT